MSKLKRIEEAPRELFKHGLTEQELLALSPDKAAIAKDWNIANKKLDWLIREYIELHNCIVDYIALLDALKVATKVTAYVLATAGGIGMILKLLGVL